MTTQGKLNMRLSLHVIKHLGISMYTQIPNALAELIANAYDADAENVHIYLNDKGKEKSIIVKDDGLGMSRDDLDENFLLIGRNRRSSGELKSPGGRKVTGKKGLGKLALFGIGNIIEVETTAKNSDEAISFTLDWNKLTRGAELVEQEKNSYSITPSSKNVEKNEQWTKITVRELKRKSGFNLDGLCKSLSRLFDFFSSEFRCWVHLNEKEEKEVRLELRYDEKDIEFRWDFQHFVQSDDSYKKKEEITGEIRASKTTLPSGLRGIALFSNGRMAHKNDFFGVSESSYAFSYITGELTVNFVDDMNEDMIATDRQSLNWNYGDMEELKEYLKKILRRVSKKWGEGRRLKKKKAINKQLGVDEKKWLSTMPNSPRKNLEKIISTISEFEFPDNQSVEIVQNLQKIAQPLPYYHWQELHSDIQRVSYQKYKEGDEVIG